MNATMPKRLGVLIATSAMACAGLIATSAGASAQANPGTAATAATSVGPLNIGAAFTVINKGSGKCLDVKDQSLLPAAQVWQWTCNSTDPNKNWLLEPVASAPGYYALRNLRSNLCLDLRAGSEADVVNGTRTQQWDCVPDAISSERWQLKVSSAVPGYFTVVSAVKGMCLDLSGGSSADGAQVQVWDCLGPVNNQLWRQG
ncbi:RICIN domain-containing protein [Streptomyces sp. NPDC002588]|uniref:RICIN domain-containing protein n=1 Tax=Streptomyces sp. NPDC002588 TaxID=3154419 RepID=UPI003317A19C